MRKAEKRKKKQKDKEIVGFIDVIIQTFLIFFFDHIHDL